MKLDKATQGFLTYLRANGYSHNTVDLYQYVLEILARFLDNPEIEEIKSLDLTSYFAYLRTDYVPNRKSGSREPLSGSTLQNHWKAIRTFFRWAEQDMELGKRPDATLKLPGNNPKVVQPFSQEDIKAILKAAQYTWVEREVRGPYAAKRRTANRDVAMILVLLDTGMRVGELCRLKIKDVDIDHGEITIAPFGNSNKKTHSRIVHLGKSARHAVWMYLSKRETEPADPLFLTEGGKSITENSVRLLLADIGDKAGVDNVHPHRFRHTFCIEFLRNDGDVFNLQALTGHNSLDILKVYLQIANCDTAKVHRKASPVDNWKL